MVEKYHRGMNGLDEGDRVCGSRECPGSRKTLRLRFHSVLLTGNIIIAKEIVISSGFRLRFYVFFFKIL